MRPSGFRTLALSESISEQRYTALGKDVDDQYFSLIKQSLVEGRNFSRTDITDNRRVMIVNDVFAKKIAPNGSAIGLKFNNDIEVIGVVQSINIPGRDMAQSRFYYPASLARNMLLIKTHQGQKFSREELIPLLKNIDNNLSLFSFTSLEEYKNRRLFSSVTTAATTLVLAFLTLILSGVGLYGILSYSSQMRRFEIGTRMAIGAKGRDIVQQVFKDNSGALFIGFLISCFCISRALFRIFKGRLLVIFH